VSWSSLLPPKLEEKGKGKEARVAVPRRSIKQERRQAALDAARAEEARTPPARTILKWPETVETEKEEERKKEKEMVAASKRWEMVRLNEDEDEIYNSAARPVRNSTTANPEDGEAGLEEYAAVQRLAHMVGMRALEEWWEDKTSADDAQ